MYAKQSAHLMVFFDTLKNTPPAVIREGLHLILPPHIFSVPVKSRSMLHHGSVWVSLKQSKRNLKKPNPNPNP